MRYTGKMPRVDHRIDHVHTETDAGLLSEMVKLGKDYRFDFEGQTIKMRVFDFRQAELRSRDKESVEQARVGVYFMGFANADLVNPNDLIGGIIQRAKKQGSILLVPQIMEIPKTANIEGEVMLAALGNYSDRDAKLKEIDGVLQQQLLADNIAIDFSIQDVELYGFSDGNRILLKTAEKIDKILPTYRSDGSQAHRRIISLSATSVIDEVPREKKPTGKAHAERFKSQVEWAVIEETRLRLNHRIDEEQARLRQELFKVMQEQHLPETAGGYGKAEQLIMEKTKGVGNDDYPFYSHGLTHIPEAKYARDPRAMESVVMAVIKLWSFPYGIEFFLQQVRESGEENIKLLMDVLNRVVSHPKSSDNDQRKWRQMFNLGLGLAGMQKIIQKQFVHAEHRLDEVCNHLESFDVVGVWPREDFLTPPSAFGRTIRRILSEDKTGTARQIIERHSGKEVLDLVDDALKESDDEQLGNLFMENCGEWGRLLFPGAKSVSISIVGRLGSLGASHFAVMKNAKNYLDLVD